MAKSKSGATVTERRRTPRRRARDLIASGPPARGLDPGTRTELADLKLLFEDDLRESALALAAVEGWVNRVGELVGGDRVERADLQAMARDPAVEQSLEMLADNLAQLRRRMDRLAAARTP